MPPNDKDKLPGRLQRRCVSKSRHAGPVNFIGWFGGAALLHISWLRPQARPDAVVVPPVQSDHGAIQDQANGCDSRPFLHTNDGDNSAEEAQNYKPTKRMYSGLHSSTCPPAEMVPEDFEHHTAANEAENRCNHRDHVKPRSGAGSGSLGRPRWRARRRPSGANPKSAP